MSNLTPEIRTNKHGVPVKKYVRADPRATSPVGSLPAPIAAAAASKRSAAQLRAEPRSMTTLKYEPDKRLVRPYGVFEFTANDAEMLDVMSVADNANAFALLNVGIRTADEACDYLQEVGAEDLIKDRSAFTNELLERGLRPENAADMIELGQLQIRASAEAIESSPYCADAVAFHSHGALRNKDSHFDVRKMILEGSLRLADLKEIGYERLTRGNNLKIMIEPIQRHAKGETSYSLSDLGKLFDKLHEEGHDFGLNDVRAKQSIKLLERVGWDKVDTLDSMDEFTLRYNQPASEEDELTAIDAAYYEATLAHGMTGIAGPLGGRTGAYWAREYPGEARILREAGISAEAATPIMAEGKTAHETIGILNGIESALADGWL